MADAIGLIGNSGASSASTSGIRSITKSLTLPYYGMPTTWPTTISDNALNYNFIAWLNPDYPAFLVSIKNISICGTHSRYSTYAYTATIPALTFGLYIAMYQTPIDDAVSLKEMYYIGNIAIPEVSKTYTNNANTGETLKTTIKTISDIKLENPMLLIPSFAYNSGFGCGLFAMIVSGTNTRPQYGSNRLQIDATFEFSNYV